MLYELYDEIYTHGNKKYWTDLSIEIEKYCRIHDIRHINYFYHEELVKRKKGINNENM